MSAINLYKILIVFMLFVASASAFAQKNTTKQLSLYDMLDRKPMYVHGDSNVQKYIVNTLRYPMAAKENNIEGTVYVRFLIDETGKVQDAFVANKKMLGAGLEEEALRAIMGMPAWLPAIYKGKPVRVVHTLPVRFRLE